MEFTTKELFAALFTLTCGIATAFYKLFSESSRREFQYLREKNDLLEKRVERLESKIDKIMERE